MTIFFSNAHIYAHSKSPYNALQTSMCIWGHRTSSCKSHRIRPNTTHKLVIMWNMTLRVCLNRSVFLFFSLSRELSPFLLHEHVLSLLVSKLFILSLHSLYKFHVSCFVFSHFNSLPPASLSLLLHFNCDFHGYLTRSRSTCIKCPSGINLLLVLKPRLFGRISPWLSVTALPPLTLKRN